MVRERRKRLVGRVVSDKMDKTVVVRVERLVRHPRYGKVLRRTKKYKAHDEGNVCRVGDVVRIVESRPLSREKRWVVEEILKRTGAGVAAEVER
nr:30S ribosomal protein S17 [Anaerolineae bacterium]